MAAMCPGESKQRGRGPFRRPDPRSVGIAEAKWSASSFVENLAIAAGLSEPCSYFGSSNKHEPIEQISVACGRRSSGCRPGGATLLYAQIQPQEVYPAPTFCLLGAQDLSQDGLPGLGRPPRRSCRSA